MDAQNKGFSGSVRSPRGRSHSTDSSQLHVRCWKESAGKDDDDRGVLSHRFPCSFTAAGLCFVAAPYFRGARAEDGKTRNAGALTGLTYLGHLRELRPVVPVVGAHEAGDQDLPGREKNSVSQWGRHAQHEGAWVWGHGARAPRR